MEAVAQVLERTGMMSPKLQRTLDKHFVSPIGIAVGIAVGAGVGVALRSLPIGIAVGVGVAIVVTLARSRMPPGRDGSG